MIQTVTNMVFKTAR